MSYIIDTVEIKDDDVILVKFDFNEYTIEEAEGVFNTLKGIFKDNTVVGIPKGIELTVIQKETLISQLENSD